MSYFSIVTVSKMINFNLMRLYELEIKEIHSNKKKYFKILNFGKMKNFYEHKIYFSIVAFTNMIYFNLMTIYDLGLSLIKLILNLKINFFVDITYTKLIFNDIQILRESDYNCFVSEPLTNHWKIN